MKKKLSLNILINQRNKQPTQNSSLGTYFFASVINTITSSPAFVILSSVFKVQLTQKEWMPSIQRYKNFGLINKTRALVPALFTSTFIMTYGQKIWQDWHEKNQDHSRLLSMTNPKLTSIIATGGLGALLLTVGRNTVIAHTNKQKLTHKLAFTGSGINMFREICWLAAVANTIDKTNNETTLDKVKWNTLSAFVTHPADLVSRWKAGNQVKTGNPSSALVLKQLKKHPSSILQGLGWRVILINSCAFGFDYGIQLSEKINTLYQKT